MLDGLTFGWRTAFLLATLLPVIVLAASLVSTLRNSSANRTLAALLIVLTGVATPWMIGFAGFYDRWEWLSYVPFSLDLAVAPLLWFYATALAAGHLPTSWKRHLVPAALEACYKISQSAMPYEPSIGVLFDIALVFGILVYGWRSLEVLRSYRAVLAQTRSDDARFAADWLRRAVLATIIFVVVAAGYEITDLFVPLGYSGYMGLHIAVAFFALYLGIEGWRHATLQLPVLGETAGDLVEARDDRDWQALGAEIAAQTKAEGWDTDPELSLARLARLTGSNTSYVSRALNEGLGQSFSSFVNGLRCERVACALEEGSQQALLDLALEAGFASKATFNRAFVARYGCSPSAWRQRLKT